MHWTACSLILIAYTHAYGKAESVCNICRCMKSFAVCERLNLERFPDGLSSFSLITLARNRLSAIDSKQMNKIAASTRKLIDSNQIKSIPGDAFQTCNALDSLNFKFNQITDIPDGVFKNCKKLKFLSFRSNQISIIRRKTFEGLTSLENLVLYDNPISTIEMDYFKDLLNLQILRIWNNKLTCDSSLAKYVQWTTEQKIKTDVNCVLIRITI